MDSTIPENKVKVTVKKDGLVTLEGKVGWYFQRSGASACVNRIAGVCGVVNNITVTRTASPSDVRGNEFEEALKRSAEVDSRRIAVTTTSDGTVTLTGNVRSWFKREEAERAAWAAPGVSKVVDHIAVVP